MEFELKENLNKVRYPNLLAEYYAGECISDLARGANVSVEIMEDVIFGMEDLTAYESVLLANYIHVNLKYLFSPQVSILNKKSNRHKIWMKQLENDLYTIWEYDKLGSKKAHEFMYSVNRTNLVKLKLWFDMNDPYYNQFVTYAAYRKVRNEVDFWLYIIKNEGKKPRTKRLRQSVFA